MMNYHNISFYDILCIRSWHRAPTIFSSYTETQTDTLQKTVLGVLWHLERVNLERFWTTSSQHLERLNPEFKNFHQFSIFSCENRRNWKEVMFKKKLFNFNILEGHTYFQAFALDNPISLLFKTTTGCHLYFTSQHFIFFYRFLLDFQHQIIFQHDKFQKFLKENFCFSRNFIITQSDV